MIRQQNPRKQKEIKKSNTEQKMKFCVKEYVIQCNSLKQKLWDMDAYDGATNEQKIELLKNLKSVWEYGTKSN